MKEKFKVTGMSCSACQANVEKRVGKCEGVQSVAVNLLSNSMQVEYDESRLSQQDIIAAVTDAGYGASVFEAAGKQAEKKDDGGDAMEKEMKSMKQRLVVSIVFLVPLMYVAMYHMFYDWFGLQIPGFVMAAFHGTGNAVTFAFTQFLLLLPICYMNRKYFITGFHTLAKRAPNMDSLIAVGATAAIVYGVFAIFRMSYGLGHGDLELVSRYSMDIYFESAGTILTLITVGKYLETKSKGKTGEAISRLMDLAPKTALVERDGQELEIPLEQVMAGDIVIVKPGQNVPVDGVILEGSTSVDQSALTGESIPVEKAVGDTVIAASTNQSGYFKMRASKVGDDTTLAQIIHLVEEAASSKAPIAKLADKISGIFVPVVMGIALAAFLIWLAVGAAFEFALSIGIAVLVISCPCALGLATPVAIMVGTGKGAEYGILIRSAESLETAHQVQTVVLDKTGTVTEGKPRVTDVAAEGETDFIKIAASLEKASEHPLAEAVVRYASETGVGALYPVEGFEAVSGRGVHGVIDGMQWFAGNEAYMQELSKKGVLNFPERDMIKIRELAQSLAREGKTPLYFARESGFAGMVAVADTIKETSRQAVAELKAMGLHVVMLTGDNRQTAEAIRRQLSLDEVIAEVMPQDKEAKIRFFQEAGQKVAMVGDGINDAPALTRADVGIAIGAGTDIAIESADIILMKSDLMDVVSAIQLSRSVVANIKMNLFWAFFYNSVGIPLAAGIFYSMLGWKLNPMFGAAAMSLSSVCVVTNALRLRFFKPKYKGSAPKEMRQENTTGEYQVTDQINQEEGEDDSMKKVITVEGMSCGHCQATVEKALAGLAGVKTAKVDLKKKTASVQLSEEVADDVLMAAVNDAGFTAVSVEEKKGLF